MQAAYFIPGPGVLPAICDGGQSCADERKKDVWVDGVTVDKC